ncbi:MAG: MotA/TolQ/ExbB proton channel family protein, partial [Planctomycetota bacterium]
MDIASLLGLLTALGLILASISMGNAPAYSFLHIPSGLVVFGGSIAAMLICFPIRSTMRLPSVMLKVLRNQPSNRRRIVQQLVSLADTARRDGLLALELRIDEIENELVRTGIQLAVDGNAPETVEEVLRTEVNSIASRHREGRGMMEQLGRFAPAYGMIGTLIGLIMMLSEMGDPSKIGQGMAVALITTLYGAVAANVIFAPF